VELLALRPPLGVALIQVGLDVQRLDERVRIEEQLEERPEQRPEPADRAAVRFIERVLAERVVRRGGLRRADAAVFLEQPRAHAFRIDELLELDVRQLADLFLGVVDAALLADARADLSHDLLDVDAVGADGKIRHIVQPRGFAPRTPLHALSRAASPARSVRVAHSLRSFALRWPLYDRRRGPDASVWSGTRALRRCRCPGCRATGRALCRRSR